MKGMMRAIREGRIIVNVDVCINKQNVAYIDQIVELCLQVGVREFDLLHVIPQGVAFENRKDLFYDPSSTCRACTRSSASTGTPAW
jgi:MoaA/NifB/PqqE/SkfB family radical SAM enzyme